MAPNLNPIEEARWLMPDTEAESWLLPKRRLMMEQREDVFARMDKAHDAAREAGGMVLAHIDELPQTFWGTKLEAAAAAISDDLCVMEENTGGEWCLTAASLCGPTYWRLGDKIGLPLSGLHQPVPGGDPELAARVSRIFNAMRPGQIMERCNWTIQAGGERFTPSSAPLKLAAATMKPEDAARALHLRVERQTFRKLPVTGAVLFTIRICLDPLEAVFAVEDAKESLAHAWTAAHPSVAEYKGWAAYDRLMQSVL